MLTKLLSRRSFSSPPSALNIVQALPSYQKALEFAHEQHYEASIGKLRDTMKDLDSNVGKNTNLHLYINQRIASMQKITKDLAGVEDTFQSCIQIAEENDVNRTLAQKGMEHSRL